MLYGTVKRLGAFPASTPGVLICRLRSTANMKVGCFTKAGTPSAGQSYPGFALMLRRSIHLGREVSITGPSSNPTIFERMINFTQDTMPENTLKALADHGEIGALMAADGGNCEEVLQEFAKLNIWVNILAAQLQEAGAKSFVKSWNDLMEVIDSKCNELKQADYPVEFSS
jgi:hypothetical protein